MTQANEASRREFLSSTAQGAALVGAVGGLGYLMSHDSGLTDEPSLAASVTVISTGAGRARKLAVGPDDRIYVAADRAVLVFAADGTRRAQIDLPRPARCLAVSSEGNLFVGLIDHVRVFDATGTLQQTWNSPSDEAILAGIAVGGNSVYVADAGNGVVWKYDRSGNRVARIEGQDGFSAPAEFFSMTATEDDTLHIANPGRHRVETYSSDGKFVAAWGEKSREVSGFSGCCNPVGLARLNDGRFVTAERGRPRVKVYDATGRFLAQLAGPAKFADNARVSEADQSQGCQSGGLDVAVDSKDRLLVLDRVTGNIHVIG